MGQIKDYLAGYINGAKKIAVLGAGSVLRSDDAAGIMVVECLAERLGGYELPGMLLINGSTAPENFTGEIKRFHPDHLFIVDAADIKKEPGSVCVIEPGSIGGISFSTHMLPMKVMIEYLITELNIGVSVIGIQPVNLSFGGNISPEVKKTVEKLVSDLSVVCQKISKV